jgi:hypothetical protein
MNSSAIHSKQAAFPNLVIFFMDIDMMYLTVANAEDPNPNKHLK